MVSKVYHIRRNHPILHVCLKLERLGLISITERGEINLPVELLVPPEQLKDLGILKVTEEGSIKMLKEGQDLNLLLNKLLKDD